MYKLIIASRLIALVSVIALGSVNIAYAQQETDGPGLFSGEKGEFSLNSLFAGDGDPQKTEQHTDGKADEGDGKHSLSQGNTNHSDEFEQYKQWKSAKSTNNAEYQEFLLWLEYQQYQQQKEAQND